MTKVCPDCGKNNLSRLGMHITQTDCEYPELNDSVVRIVQGTLMGDASIRPSGLYELSVKEKEYTEYVADQFPGWLITSSGVHAVSSDTTKGGLMWRVRTVSHPKLKELRKQWYPNGVKKFPLDSLEPDGLLLKHWYATDGHLEQPSNRPQIASYNEDTEELRDWLNESGFDTCRDHGGVCFNKRSQSDFYDAVGEPTPGYEYKWGDYEG